MESEDASDIEEIVDGKSIQQTHLFLTFLKRLDKGGQQC